MDTLTKELINSFKKDYPYNPLVVFGEDEKYGKIPGWISSSSYSLNWLASKSLRRGLPTGRTAVIVGDPSTGKTAIAISCMRDPSIDLIVYLDSEGGGADASFAEFLGADPKKILYSPVDTMDELKSKMSKVIDTIEKNQSTKKVLVVIDSMSMISTEKEMNPEKGCYVEGTIVPTTDGSKPIEAITIGNKVITHLGEWKEVEKVWEYTDKDDLIEITMENDITIKLTPNHRLLVQRDGSLQWIAAEDLKVTDLLQQLDNKKH